ncbi:MAG: transglycosylase SLT domain-containing protein [Dysgonamonadaceae bacterium]|nr:transglycosylase SLT domain-containing protein [Dysgonamonadaceae bacterium]
MKEHFLVLLSVAVLLATGCTRKNAHSGRDDFSRILSKGEIDVLTVSGSMSYFIYKGEPRGYEYELLNSFAENYKLKVNIRPVENETKLMEMLLRGEGDLIACNIPISNEGKEKLLYCGREVINEQVLVQRANRGDTLLKDVTGLIGKEVWVIHDSKHYKRLVNLDNELGGGIHIRTIDKDTVSVEDLIEMVSKGKLAYTVSDADMAGLNKTYFQNLNIAMVVGHSQRSSWATGKDSPKLAAAIDKWFTENQNKAGYKKITKRYFEMSKLPGDEPAPVIGPGQISPYDSLFRRYAAKIPWDWRLLASVSYQESKFHTDLVSWAGATGLMGLMPRTAQAFGISEDMIFDPESNVRAAVDLIKRLNRSFSAIEDENERIKFILASYNAGSGHIYDAQALAEKYDKNAYLWSDVEEYLKLKSLQEYYNDPVCKQGYFRSGETVNYVRNVFERWIYYGEAVKN